MLPRRKHLSIPDACHALLDQGLGVAGGGLVLAEPDLEQTWLWTTPNRQTLGIAGNCEFGVPNSDVYAVGNTNLWFADEAHSQLQQARSSIVAPVAASPRGVVRIAHLDTGYDNNHATKPQFLNHPPGPQFRRRRPAERCHRQADGCH